MWVGGAGKADKTAPSNMGATTRIHILTVTQNSSLTNWITTIYVIAGLCQSRKVTSGQLTVFWSSSSFWNRPCNVLRRYLDVAQLAVNTILRVN